MEYVFNTLNELILSSPILAANYILQCVFFGLTLSSFLAFLLKMINFAYADFVASNTLVRIFVVGCFIYMKAWNNWSSKLIFVGYGTSLFIAMYVYDCCCNLSEKYQNKIRGFYTGQVFIFVWSSMFGLYALYLLKYDNYHLYYLIGQIATIYFYNAFKNRHIIHSTTIIFALIGYILLKYFMDYIFQAERRMLPLHIVPFIMMAFDAEFRQAKHLKKEHDSATRECLKMCTYFTVYILLNNPNIHFEYVLFIVWVIGSIFPKNY